MATRIALRRRNGILEFLGVVGKGGKIRKVKTRAVRLRNPSSGVDSSMASELASYAETYVNMEPFYKNLTIKIAQGRYDSNKAVTLMKYAVERAMKGYGVSKRDVSTATRIDAAERLRNRFESIERSGEFEKYIPKKYRK